MTLSTIRQAFSTEVARSWHGEGPQHPAGHMCRGRRRFQPHGKKRRQIGLQLLYISPKAFVNSVLAWAKPALQAPLQQALCEVTAQVTRLQDKVVGIHNLQTSIFVLQDVAHSHF